MKFNVTSRHKPTVIISQMVQTSVAPSVHSHLTGHLFSADIGETLYNFRVLRMDASLFVYIGSAGQETFQEMAVAMPAPAGTTTSGTTILGDPLGSSLELATSFAKRLQKQVYVSCNVPAELEIRQALVRRFVEEVRACAEHF